MGHFGQIFHNCTGAHTNAQKLKHDLDHQMSAHMVQENHKQNLKIKNNVGKKVVYFISLFLDDTVVVSGLVRPFQGFLDLIPLHICQPQKGS